MEFQEDSKGVPFYSPNLRENLKHRIESIAVNNGLETT